MDKIERKRYFHSAKVILLSDFFTGVAGVWGWGGVWGGEGGVPDPERRESVANKNLRVYAETSAACVCVCVCVCVCGGGVVGGGGCFSVWCFVQVVLVGLCSTCVQNIIFRLICIM